MMTPGMYLTKAGKTVLIEAIGDSPRARREYNIPTDAVWYIVVEERINGERVNVDHVFSMDANGVCVQARHGNREDWDLVVQPGPPLEAA